MCEITVVNPDSIGTATTMNLAADLFEEQGDGVGFLMVKNRGDHFEYEHYKSTTPHWATIFQFLKRHWEDTWRVVVHARAKTNGKVNRETAHPIHVDCEQCDVEWVIHNGHVRNRQQQMASMISAGHDFTTDIDTEIIAHKVSEIPDDVSSLDSDTYNMKGNLNYFTFAEDGILVHLGTKYYVTDDFTVTCRKRKRKDPFSKRAIQFDNQTEWAIIRPGEDEPEIDTKNRQVYWSGSSKYARRSRSTSNNAANSGRSWAYDEQENRASPEAEEADTSMAENDYTIDDEGQLVEVYEDLLDDLAEASAYRVAPGVLKVIYHKDNHVEYVTRENQPEIYFWATGEEIGKQILELYRAYGWMEDGGPDDDNDGNAGGAATSDEEYGDARDEIDATVQETTHGTIASVADIDGDIDPDAMLEADGPRDFPTGDGKHSPLTELEVSTAVDEMAKLVEKQDEQYESPEEIAVGRIKKMTPASVRDFLESRKSEITGVY